MYSKCFIFYSFSIVELCEEVISSIDDCLEDETGVSGDSTIAIVTAERNAGTDW